MDALFVFIISGLYIIFISGYCDINLLASSASVFVRITVKFLYEVLLKVSFGFPRNFNPAGNITHLAPGRESLPIPTTFFPIYTVVLQITPLRAPDPIRRTESGIVIEFTDISLPDITLFAIA